MNRISRRPKKSLGQNFLTDANIARKIVAALDLQPDDPVLEIGPGYGALTRLIQPQVQQFWGIELDTRLAQQLAAEFAEHPNFLVIENDFVKVDLASLLANQRAVKVVGNIPYHITSNIIFRVIENRKLFKSLTLMIQYEVAERVVAKPDSKDFGILAVLSQTFSEPQLLFTVSRNVFYPKPAVTSAVVQWNFAKTDPHPVADEIGYMQLVKHVFQTRRKMLRNSLKSFCGADFNSIDFPIDLRRRPEDLFISEFVRIWDAIKNKL